MGAWGIQHWLIVAVVVLLLFGGRGKISSLMGDFAQGIKAFKKGMSEDPDATAKQDAPMRSLDHDNTAEIKRRAESESKV